MHQVIKAKCDIANDNASHCHCHGLHIHALMKQAVDNAC